MTELSTPKNTLYLISMFFPTFLLNTRNSDYTSKAPVQQNSGDISIIPLTNTSTSHGHVFGAQPSFFIRSPLSLFLTNTNHGHGHVLIPDLRTRTRSTNTSSSSSGRPSAVSGLCPPSTSTPHEHVFIPALRTRITSTFFSPRLPSTSHGHDTRTVSRMGFGQQSVNR